MPLYPEFEDGSRLRAENLHAQTMFLVQQAGLAILGASAGRWGFFRLPNSKDYPNEFSLNDGCLKVARLCLLTQAGLALVADKVETAVQHCPATVFLKWSLPQGRGQGTGHDIVSVEPKIEFDEFSPKDTLNDSGLWITEIAQVTEDGTLKLLVPAITFDASPELAKAHKNFTEVLDPLVKALKASKQGDITARSEPALAARLCSQTGPKTETAGWFRMATWLFTSLHDLLRDNEGQSTLDSVRLDELLNLPLAFHSDLCNWLKLATEKLNEDNGIRRWLRDEEVKPDQGYPVDYSIGTRLYKYTFQTRWPGRELKLRVIGLDGPPHVYCEFAEASAVGPTTGKMPDFILGSDGRYSVQFPVLRDVLFLKVPKNGTAELKLCDP